ncbi:MAG: hypothetical protein BLM47_09525 [Candidatus Reconcilbacillus cellulovorans]|uniref:YwiC-like protein n=1 Tax=Candidatus Reconcilbacillus cellulovorans TaxID=1906605 RepID=A0A2A6DZV6_9BACL|nr:MAG: hypothetical protein BLM47_09525 [Candidatus Reconcilbacillus cellulovorans]
MSASRRAYVPKQHGAWAMLAVPFWFGMIASGPKPVHALLFAVWLSAYLLSYPLLQWVRTGKKSLYGRPTFVYAALLAASGSALAAVRPDLARWLPAFAPLFLVNVAYAAKNRERAFWNDIAAVVQFSLIVFVAYDAGGGRDWPLAGELFGLSVLYFAGTVFFVKTIIRERHNRRFYRLSVAYHAAVVAVAAVWFPPGMLPPLVVLLVRAAWTPRTRLTVKQTGMLEIAYSVLVSVFAGAIYG